MCREKTMWDKKEKVSQGARPQERPTLPEPRSWIFSFQSCEKLNFCGLNQPVFIMAVWAKGYNPPLYCPGTLLPESRTEAGVSVTLPYTTEQMWLLECSGCRLLKNAELGISKRLLVPRGAARWSDSAYCAKPSHFQKWLHHEEQLQRNSPAKAAGGCGCGQPSDRLQERTAYVTHTSRDFKHSKELIFRKLGFMHRKFGEMSQKN